MIQEAQKFFFCRWRLALHLLLICCIASVICSVFFIFYKDALEDNLPLGYEGDTLAVLASIKAAEEGGVRPFAPIKIARLNAPEEAWWSDVPISEFVFWLPSILCPWLGLIQASSCFVCIAICLAGLAFYCSAVLIGVHPLPSATLAILYGLLPYAFVRNLEHVMLTLYFVVPLFILCAARLWGEDGSKRSLKEVGILGLVALLCSLFNPYYWAMFLILLAFVGIGQLAKFSVKGILFCLFVGVAACLGFILQNIDTFYFRFTEGANPSAVSRDLWWMIKFGLYLPDLLLPSTHRYGLLEFFGGKDYHWKIPPQIQGESQTAYIGILAACGLVLLVVVGFIRASAQSKKQQHFLFWFSLIVFIFSVVGGLNYLLGAFGFQMLRASNRYSIFLATFGLFYFGLLLSRMKSWPLLLGVCFILLPLGIWDQIPEVPDWQKNQRQNAIERFRLDREFFPEMERRLPDGAMVFQFPVHAFPEMGPVHEMGDYEHFRPYLHTKNLRFSYGTVKGRTGSDWQAKLDDNKPLEVTTVLVAKGFGHVLINRRAYADQGEGLKKRLEGVGMREIMQNKDFFILEIGAGKG